MKYDKKKFRNVRKLIKMREYKQQTNLLNSIITTS